MTSFDLLCDSPKLKGDICWSQKHGGNRVRKSLYEQSMPFVKGHLIVYKISNNLIIIGELCFIVSFLRIIWITFKMYWFLIGPEGVHVKPHGLKVIDPRDKPTPFVLLNTHVVKLSHKYPYACIRVAFSLDKGIVSLQWMEVNAKTHSWLRCWEHVLFSA